MAEYQVGSAEVTKLRSKADNAGQRKETRAPAGDVHAVVGTPGTWAPAACGAYVEVFPDPWAEGTFRRCLVCVSRAPVGG